MILVNQLVIRLLDIDAGVIRSNTSDRNERITEFCGEYHSELWKTEEKRVIFSGESLQYLISIIPD
jgi:hypothetical protein